jgi:hypothetical protein
MSDIVQISVSSSGRLKAVYGDNDVLVLSASGSLFAYQSGSSLLRQTCEFAVSKYSNRLCSAIEFRNMHLDAVVWCRAMSKKHATSLFSVGYPISLVRWPCSCNEAIETQRLQVIDPSALHGFDDRITAQALH